MKAEVFARAEYFLRLMAVGVTLLISTFVIGTMSVPAAHAASGTANFTLQPTLYDPKNLITESYYILNPDPGTTMSLGIRVTNNGIAAGSVSLYPVDATTGETSGVVFRLHGDLRTDVGAWITLHSSQLTLAAGQSTIVPFQLTIPQNTRPGQHMGGIVAEGTDIQTAPTKNKHFQVNIHHLFIMAVQVNLPGPTIEQLTASGIQAGGANNYQNLQLLLRNSGTVMLKGSGSLQVTDPHGSLLQNLPITLDTFLPDTTINYPVNVQHQALAPGDYRAILNLIYGHNHLLHYVTAFTITQQQVTQVFQPNGNGPLQSPVTSLFGTLPVWLIACIGLLLASGAFFWGQKIYRLLAVSRHNHKTSK